MPRLMKTSAALAVALVLGVTALTGSSTASAADQPAPSARRYTSAQANAIFDRLQAALTPKHAAPRTLGDPLPRKDLGLLMREAKGARGSMTARQQSIIDSNGRPVPDSAGCTTPFLSSWTVLEGNHFCIHYRPNLSVAQGGATLHQAQLTLDTMNHVYDKEHNTLGYNAPLPDSDGKTDVFLDQIGNRGYYGFCTTDDNSSTSTAWCGLDNDFAVSEFGAKPINSLRVTAAHEFFHAIQFGYDANDLTWFLEGTAVWMEDTVYPTINDYLQYLPLSQIVKPRQSADYVGGLERYGTVIFWKYLSEHFHDVNIIRSIWNAAAVSHGSKTGLQAAIGVVTGRGHSFPAEFANYGVWNTLPPGTYSDRGLWPKPGSWATATLSSAHRDTGALSVKLNHLAHAPLVLKVGSGVPSYAKLYLYLDEPSLSKGARATLQLRLKSGGVKLYPINLNSNGNANKVYALDTRYVKSAIVIMSNTSTIYNAQPYRIRARVGF